MGLNKRSYGARMSMHCIFFLRYLTIFWRKLELDIWTDLAAAPPEMLCRGHFQFLPETIATESKATIHKVFFKILTSIPPKKKTNEKQKKRPYGLLPL